jgi:hypothetical protein
MSNKNTISINGEQVPAPVRDPLRIGQEYWLADLSSPTPVPDCWCWDDTPTDRRCLENGLIHRTEADARAHIDAMKRANKGETE